MASISLLIAFLAGTALHIDTCQVPSSLHPIGVPLPLAETFSEAEELAPPRIIQSHVSRRGIMELNSICGESVALRDHGKDLFPKQLIERIVAFSSSLPSFCATSATGQGREATISAPCLFITLLSTSSASPIHYTQASLLRPGNCLSSLQLPLNAVSGKKQSLHFPSLFVLFLLLQDISDAP